ncbi:MAG: polysaccharide deacetylase family protein [Clostridia bacterium]|nr:polysaccharide deacetylase family protein [Clostridia bacterium]
MKIVCIKAKHIMASITLALVLAMLMVATSATNSAAVFLGSSPRLVPIYSVKTEEKKVALSFDAAWGSDKTSKIVEILQKEGIKATFFLVGFWVEANPDKVKEIYDAGFDIGTHSNTHPKMSTLSSAQVSHELVTSCELISNITKSPVKFFRPPYGDYNDQLINIASSLGLKTIQWDVDTLDWKGLSGEQILTRVQRSVKNGSIILCHNNSDHILEALPLMIKYLKSEGYSIVKMSELVYENDYTIDNNGVQIKNKG